MSYFPKPSLNENDLAIIERGATAAHSIDAGQYVSWHGRTGKAKAAILQGATLSDSLFDYDEDGALNASLEYSTTEKVAGKWIDGAIIYKRTWNNIYYSSMDKNVDKQAIGLSSIIDVTKIIKIEGIMRYALNTASPLGVYCNAYINSAGILMVNQGYGSPANTSFDITIYYTK